MSNHRVVVTAGAVPSVVDKWGFRRRDAPLGLGIGRAVTQAVGLG
jgi:hypothetical protein